MLGSVLDLFLSPRCNWSIGLLGVHESNFDHLASIPPNGFPVKEFKLF